LKELGVPQQPAGLPGLSDLDAGQSMGNSPEPMMKGGNFTSDFFLNKGDKPKVTKLKQGEERSFNAEFKKVLASAVDDIKLKKKDKRAIQAKINKVARQFSRNLKDLTAKKVKQDYMKSVEDVEKELNQNFSFGKADQNAINAITDSKVFSESFENVEKKMAKRLNKVLARAFREPERFTIDNIVSEMKEEADLSEGQLRTIARTETTKIANAARKTSYDKADDGSFRYSWIGPSDQRTTQTCNNISRRTDKGVKMDELLRIMKQETKKEFPEFTVNKDAMAAHYNCRHVMLRIK